MTTRVSTRQLNDNTVSPLDFGAKGDGTTDDTAAMQRALDNVSATTGPRTLDLLGFNYKVVSTLTLIGNGVTVMNGTITFVPTTGGDLLFEVGPATQVDSTSYNLNDGSKLRPGRRSFTMEDSTLDVGDNTYIWIQDKTWDYVYKGIQERAENQFPRGDIAFKGDLLKVEWSDKEAATNVYHTYNPFTVRYDDVTGTEVFALTMNDDVQFIDVNLVGPGIVRKSMTMTSMNINAADHVRTLTYGTHTFGVGEYLTIDTGDKETSDSTAKVIQGYWKITAATGTTMDFSNITDTIGGVSYTGSLKAAAAAATGTTDWDAWVYTGCEVAMNVQHVANFKMTGCRVTGFGEAGVVLTKCYEPKITGCCITQERPEASSGIVLANGTYGGEVVDNTFTGYRGVAVGSTWHHILRDRSDVSLGYTGCTSKTLIKNNKFTCKDIAIRTLDNAFYTTICDNNIELLSTFLAERESTTGYRRNLAQGVRSTGVFCDILRNTIKGQMTLGVMHKQKQKVIYVGADESPADGSDIGDSDGNYLFEGQAGTSETADGGSYNRGQRDIGQELDHFYVRICDNVIEGTNSYPSIHASTNLLTISKYGIFITNDTFAKASQRRAGLLRINIENNKVIGQAQNIRINASSGWVQGLSIVNNYLDSKPYYDRTNFWNLYGDSYSTHRQGLQKGSAIALMVDNFDEFPSGHRYKQEFRDVTIHNNVLYRSIKRQDTCPDANGNTLQEMIDNKLIYGGSVAHITTYINSKNGASFKHFSIQSNRMNYGGWGIYSSGTTNINPSTQTDVLHSYWYVHNNTMNVNQTQNHTGTVQDDSNDPLSTSTFNYLPSVYIGEEVGNLVHSYLNYGNYYANGDVTTTRGVPGDDDGTTWVDVARLMSNNTIEF